MKSFQLHMKACNRSAQSAPIATPSLAEARIIRPIRVAARRANEKMIIWKTRLNDKHCDWFDDDEVETNLSMEFSERQNGFDEDIEFPIVEIDDHLSNPWTYDDTGN